MPSPTYIISTLPDLYAVVIDLLAEHHHLQQARHLLDEKQLI
jgi:hypothetical protein